MKLLTDEALIDAYRRSLNLDLEQEFINLLLEEIYQRNIDLELI